MGYNYYELRFVISKDDYENNHLSYGTGEDLETLTYGLQRESKDESTYICTAKVTKDFHEEMFYGLLLALAGFLFAMVLTPFYTHFAYKYKFWKKLKGLRLK